MNNNEQPQLAKTAFVFGLAGFIAGILLAPKTGKESREDLANKTAELKSRAVSTTNQIKDAASKRADEVKSNAKKTTEKLKNVKDEAVADAKDTARRTKSDTENIADSTFRQSTM